MKVQVGSLESKSQLVLSLNQVLSLQIPEISDKSLAHILRVIDETKALISEHIDYQEVLQEQKKRIPDSLIPQLSMLALLVGIRIPENENEKNVVLRAMKVLRQRILYYTNHPDIVLGGEGK